MSKRDRLLKGLNDEDKNIIKDADELVNKETNELSFKDLKNKKVKLKTRVFSLLGLFIMLCFVFVLWWQDDFKTSGNYYIVCEHSSCINPFVNSSFCENNPSDVICSYKALDRGVYGEPPSWIEKNASILMVCFAVFWLILVLVFDKYVFGGFKNG